MQHILCSVTIGSLVKFVRFVQLTAVLNIFPQNNQSFIQIFSKKYYNGTTVTFEIEFLIFLYITQHESNQLFSQFKLSIIDFQFTNNRTYFVISSVRNVP